MRTCLCLLVFFISCGVLSTSGFAQTVALEDADRLYDFAETLDPTLFSPPAETQQLNVADSNWFLRSYATTGVFLAINIDGTGPFTAGDVYALGGPFGDVPVYIDRLDILIAAIDSISAGDEDSDGISNALDQCPTTTAGQSVDEAGCSSAQLDDDNDGVSNADDQCLATPAGVPVGESGCSAAQQGILVTLADANKLLNFAEQLDGIAFGPPTTTQQISQEGSSWFVRSYTSSGISIMVNIDGTRSFLAGNVYLTGGPFGVQLVLIDTLANLVAFIDSQSPADDDNDGVADGEDQCPATTAGQPVDTQGCSVTQLDDDQDNVNNAADLCPATPGGQSVDANGCSATQLDDDQDGVNNADDLCPATPNDESIIVNGCSDSQLDNPQSGLPSLPLPDCVANGLSPTQFVDCEGMILSSITYGSPPELSRPAPGSILVENSPSTIDFRDDVDRGGQQWVTITLQLPPLPDVTLPNGNKLRSAIHIDWPRGFGPANGYLNCKHPGPGPSQQWRVDGCDFFSPGPGQGSALFWREGPDCSSTDTSCTYRVRWREYQTRVRHPMILRAYVGWSIVHTQQNSNGDYPTGCSSLGPQGCLAGGGSNWFTFDVSGPPPPLVIDAQARRVGAASFEFDGSGSRPDIRSWRWSAPGSGNVYATTPTFTRSFTYDDFPFGVGQVILDIVDRWDRTALTSVNVSILAPAGVEGPLELRVFEVLGIDDNGLITMRAVVRNVSESILRNVFVLGNEFLGLVSVQATPDSNTIAAGAEAEFIVTTQFDNRNRLNITAQAFGTGDAGDVKSTSEALTVRRDSL